MSFLLEFKGKLDILSITATKTLNSGASIRPEPMKHSPISET